MASPRSFAVPFFVLAVVLFLLGVLSPEQRHARARLAANRRHHPDDPELTADDAAELERAALDRHIDELVAKAGRMSSEQSDTLRRLFRYGPAED
jgi:hypothetical protein